MKICTPNSTKKCTVTFIFQYRHGFIRKCGSSFREALETSKQVDELWFRYGGSKSQNSSFCTLTNVSISWYLGNRQLLTGKTSLPIPSAGSIPIFNDCRAAIAIERMGTLDAIVMLQYSVVKALDVSRCRSRIFLVTYHVIRHATRFHDPCHNALPNVVKKNLHICSTVWFLVLKPFQTLSMFGKVCLSTPLSFQHHWTMENQSAAEHCPRKHP